jgi:predicted N-acetyltransferase YhbS
MMMYTLREYTSDHLPAELANQVASFIRIFWLNENKGEDRFWELLPPNPTVRHFVIAERGILISHALVRQLTITHLGNPYKLYGVGSVMTYPAFRGEGYGRRVVEAATAYILNSDADIGMLFTAPETAPFYEASGWAALNKTGVYYGDPAQPEYDDAFIMMLHVSEQAKVQRANFEEGTMFVGAFLW